MTHSKLTKEEKLVLSTYIKLVRAAESVSARAHKHLDKDNITFGQFSVLEALYHLGSMCQKDLAGKILKSPRNITMIVDNLEKRDLVERRRNKGDRRYWDIHLTEQGSALFETIFSRHVKKIEEEMAVLTTDELKALGDLCRTVGKRQK